MELITASFDVDAQKGFTPICPDQLPVPEGDQIVSELNRMATLTNFRVGSKDWHNTQAAWIAGVDYPQFTPFASTFMAKIFKRGDMDIMWNSHCIGGTEGAELLDGLPHPLDYDFFVWKGMEPDVHPYGACYHDLKETRSTGVIEWLMSRHVQRICIGGLATDFCVMNTALQLSRYFEVCLYLPACRSIAKDVTPYLEGMRMKGVLIAETFEQLQVLMGA